MTGSFEGLAAPATVARLHEGVAKGARGPAIGDLMITKGDERQRSRARRDLTPEQLESLKQGRLYIQVHSEKGVAPDGSNLWGGCCDDLLRLRDAFGLSRHQESSLASV